MSSKITKFAEVYLVGNDLMVIDVDGDLMTWNDWLTRMKDTANDHLSRG